MFSRYPILKGAQRWTTTTYNDDINSAWIIVCNGKYSSADKRKENSYHSMELAKANPTLAFSRRYRAMFSDCQCENSQISCSICTGVIRYRGASPSYDRWIVDRFCSRNSNISRNTRWKRFWCRWSRKRSLMAFPESPSEQRGRNWESWVVTEPGGSETEPGRSELRCDSLLALQSRVTSDE